MIDCISSSPKTVYNMKYNINMGHILINCEDIFEGTKNMSTRARLSKGQFDLVTHTYTQTQPYMHAHIQYTNKFTHTHTPFHTQTDSDDYICCVSCSINRYHSVSFLCRKFVLVFYNKVKGKKSDEAR